MRHGRTDDNQTEIVDALRKAGCKVAITSDAGYGFPDIVVWTPIQKRIILIEIKDDKKPMSKRQLTPAQKKFHKFWKSTGCVYVAKNVDEALLICGFGDMDCRCRMAGL
jgi:Holliday junction resolvase